MNRKGVSLLEVLIALTILAFVGNSFIMALANSLSTNERVETTERIVADQDRLLSAYVLLNATDFVEMLGTQKVGPYTVTILQALPDLYRIRIVHDSVPAALETLAYRPRENVL